MRAVVGAVALALLVTALPAEGHPFPKTEKALRELSHDTLQEIDATNAQMIREAQKVIREARKTLGPMPTVPALPGTGQGSLEVRASLVQPGIRGIDDMLAATWLGSSAGYWTGAYWVESNSGGSIMPNFAEIGEMGVLLYLDGGSLVTGSSINVTYHFLGADGKYLRYPLREIPILAERPVEERVDIGGAHASARGKSPEAILITPWNLFDHNVTMGMTLLAGDVHLDDITVAGCADIEARETEPGCRLLYVLQFPAVLTSLQLWHIDEAGARVVDRELSRIDLLSGALYAP